MQCMLQLLKWPWVPKSCDPESLLKLIGLLSFQRCIHINCLYIFVWKCDICTRPLHNTFCVKSHIFAGSPLGVSLFSPYISRVPPYLSPTLLKANVFLSEINQDVRRVSSNDFLWTSYWGPQFLRFLILSLYSIPVVLF